MKYACDIWPKIGGGCCHEMLSLSKSADLGCVQCQFDLRLDKIFVIHDLMKLTYMVGHGSSSIGCLL